jgi:hypothetical protein
MKPQSTDHPPYYDRYVSLVKQDELLKALQETRNEALRLIQSIPTHLEGHAYAEGKWTIREVILHCIDTERVFSYRALSFARGDRQKMLPFEENDYAANSRANSRSLANIAEELKAVGEATSSLFTSFAPDVLALSGETPSGKATVNSMGFMIPGHWIHHMNVIRERYLTGK